MHAYFRNYRVRFWFRLLIVGLSGIATTSNAAYPERSIRIIVPATAGGGNDAITRLVGRKISDIFGKPVVIDNRPGGGTIIGTDLVAKAPADGYALVMVVNSHTINPGLVQKLPYDSVRDFAPISLVASAPLALVKHPSVPFRNVKELVAAARKQPQLLNYASSGNGTASHLAGVLFATTSSITLTHIPYKGSAPALTDLLAGQVQFMFATLPSAIPQVRAARLRVLAVTSAAPTSLLPETPTIAASGLPGYEITQLYGLLAPAGTPPEIVTALHAAVTRALAMPDVVERLKREGAEPIGNSPQAFSAFIRDDIERWIKIIRQANVKVD